MAGNFDRAAAKTPTSIGIISVTMTDDSQNKRAFYTVEVRDQNGAELKVPGDSGNLVPYLSQADIAWLVDFMTRLRAKAVAEFLAP